MKLDIRGHHLKVTDALHIHIKRRLQFALSRFESRVLQVTVRLADLNGPRGGVDKQCRMAVAIPSSGHIRAEVTDADLYTAIDRAADRIGHAVARELHRQPERGLGVSEVSRISAAILFQRQRRGYGEENLTK
jgi:ribosomal subunit interface protein